MNEGLEAARCGLHGLPVDSPSRLVGGDPNSAGFVLCSENLFGWSHSLAPHSLSAQERSREESRRDSLCRLSVRRSGLERRVVPARPDGRVRVASLESGLRGSQFRRGSRSGSRRGIGRFGHPLESRRRNLLGSGSKRRTRIRSSGVGRGSRRRWRYRFRPRGIPGGAERLAERRRKRVSFPRHPGPPGNERGPWGWEISTETSIS